MSVAYNQKLNGRAERRNRTHIEAPGQAKYSDLGHKISWGRSTVNSCLYTRTVSFQHTPGNITPYDKVFDMRHAISHCVCISDRNVSCKVSWWKLSQIRDKAKEWSTYRLWRRSIYVVVDMSRKKLRTWQHNFIREQIVQQYSLDSPVEFRTKLQTPASLMTTRLTRLTKRGNKQSTSSVEVWGTDPTRCPNESATRSSLPRSQMMHPDISKNLARQGLPVSIWQPILKSREWGSVASAGNTLFSGWTNVCGLVIIKATTSPIRTFFQR